jgi:peptidoglycan-associated lipoprotein
LEDEVKNRKWFTLIAAVLALVALSACNKKKPTPPPPSVPPPPAPTASLNANPTTVDRGQQVTLSWRTENATDVSIQPGVGKVDLSGSQSVTPTESTTYRLTANGPGGTQEATARVTVNQPPPPPPPQQTSETLQQSFASNVKDVYFDYDKDDLRPDGQAAAQADAQWLKAHPQAKITIEGHCDERGSTEYNLDLGDRRARSVMNALVQLGVPSSQMSTKSFGKEAPFCTESNEDCWQRNRVGHFVLSGGQ